MEFSYKVSEAEYLSASRLGTKVPSRSTLKTVVFWLFVLLCFMVFFSVVQRNGRQTDSSGQPAPAQTSEVEPVHQAAPTRALLYNAAPIVLIVGFWFFVIKVILPGRLKKMYTKDPLMQGEFTVGITPEGVSICNTAGTSSRTPWTIYDCWREAESVIILVLHTRVYFAVSLTGLSEARKTELRGILSAALPKR